MVEPETLMKLAIEKCHQGLAAGQSPFGCAIACGDVVLAVCHNTVLATVDITAHAEINALRSAARSSGNIFLPETVVATTCEPCPMCMAALQWSRVKTVYYGATVDDAKAAGFQELQIASSIMAELGGNKVELRPNLLREECRALFDLWKARPDAQIY